MLVEIACPPSDGSYGCHFSLATAGPTMMLNGEWIAPLLDHALLSVSPIALSETAQRLAASLARGSPCSVREALKPSRLLESLHAALERVGADRTAQQTLAAELRDQLAPALAQLGVNAGFLRLEIVHERTCPKLHVDRLRWRICCTLAGAGTEYLPPGASPEYDEARLQQLPAGAVAAMAGGLSGPGLWHRSPHACAAHPRLFLSVDIV